VGTDRAVIQLVTRCGSAEEFIERFARFTTETDVVVPALPHLRVGAAGSFAICLKDRSVMMQGRCEVTEIRPAAVAPGSAPGASVPALMRLRLREMDAHSCGIHLRLMERHSSSPRPPAVPAPAPPPMPSVANAVPIETPVVDQSAATVVRDARPSLDVSEPTVISPPPSEARVAGAPFTLPANPLGDLDAADLASFVEHTLLEANAADHARRITRRAAPFALCLLGGLLLGIAIRAGTTAAPVVGAPNLVSSPQAASPRP
jgi:hypothetical protein